MAQRFSPTASGGYSAADIYGRRPDPVTLANPATDLASVYPNLSGTNAALSEEILRMIQGTDPNLPILAQNTGAARGAAAGMPGSQFAERMGDLSLYDRRAAQRAQGISAYNQTVPTISSTQTNSPALQAQVQSQNNIWASAPDPAAAAQEALRLYQQQLNNLSGSFSSPRTPSQSSGGGSWFSNTPINRSMPAPTAVGGLVTSDDPFGWNPGGFSQASQTPAGSSWNTMAFGGGGGGGGNAPLVINGYETYDPSYYEEMANIYNPGINSSGMDWSQFE